MSFGGFTFGALEKKRKSASDSLKQSDINQSDKTEAFYQYKKLTLRYSL